MTWRIDWYKSYDLSDLTTGRCAYCTDANSLYARYDSGGYDVSVLCRNKCGFEVYARFADDGSQWVEVAGIYYAEENYVVYFGEKRWGYFFADGSDATEEGRDSNIDVHEMAIRLRKMALLA